MPSDLDRHVRSRTSVGVYGVPPALEGLSDHTILAVASFLQDLRMYEQVLTGLVCQVQRGTLKRPDRTDQFRRLHSAVWTSYWQVLAVWGVDEPVVGNVCTAEQGQAWRDSVAARIRLAVDEITWTRGEGGSIYGGHFTYWETPSMVDTPRGILGPLL